MYSQRTRSNFRSTSSPFLFGGFVEIALHLCKQSSCFVLLFPSLWSCSSNSMIIPLSFCLSFYVHDCSVNHFVQFRFSLISHFPHSFCSTYLCSLSQWFPLRQPPQRKGSLSARPTSEPVTSLNQETMQALDTLAEEWEAFEVTMKKVASGHEWEDMLCGMISEVAGEARQSSKGTRPLTR